MAVNNSRNMREELEQGVMDNTYMMLYPNRGGVVEDTDAWRLTWPNYGMAEHRPPPPQILGCGCEHGSDLDNRSPGMSDNDADDVHR